MLTILAITLTAHAEITGADPSSVDCGSFNAISCGSASDCPDYEGMQCGTGPEGHDLCDGANICWRYKPDGVNLVIPRPPTNVDMSGQVDGPGHWILEALQDDGDDDSDRFGLTLQASAELELQVSSAVWVDVYDTSGEHAELLTYDEADLGAGYTLSLPAGSYEVVVHADAEGPLESYDVQLIVN